MGVIFAPALVTAIAPGFHADPAKFALAVQLTRIMFPFLLLVALAAQAMGVLNACNQFFVPAMASTFFNIGSVAFGLAIGYLLGPKIGISRIAGMAFGVVLGGGLQFGWQIPSMLRSGFRYRLDFRWNHPGLIHIVKLMGPAILGNAATLINVTVSTNFASQLGDGPVSWLSYAFRFMQLPIGIFGVAIASATLPSISRSAAAKNYDEFRRTLSRSISMVFLLTIPSSVGLHVLGKSIIGAIYQGHRFTVFHTEQTAIALSCYAIGLAGYAALKVVSPAFYALGDARTPMYISLLSILVNFGMAYALTPYLRHAGLALATSAVATFGFLTQFSIIRVRIGGIYGRRLLDSVLRVCAASAAMGGVVWLSSRFMTARFGVSQFAHLADLLVSMPIGLAVFYLSCRALKVPDLDSALEALARPVMRRIRRVRHG
jgi:putative peptidoglycan lipid II flippase